MEKSENVEELVKELERTRRQNERLEKELVESSALIASLRMHLQNLEHCSTGGGSASSSRSPSTTPVDVVPKVMKEGVRRVVTGLEGNVAQRVRSAKQDHPYKKRKERTGTGEPGRSRYWTSTEHKLFLDALREFGHKDLKSIAAHVRTRNITQVRTHSQKYFMRLMREAQRLKDASGEEECSDSNEKPGNATCGVSLLSLVAEETCRW